MTIDGRTEPGSASGSAINECRHVTPQPGEVAPSQFAACHVALMQARRDGSVPADSPAR